MAERLKSAAIVALSLSLVALLGLSFSLGIYGGRVGPWQAITGLFDTGSVDSGEAEVSPQPAAWPGQVAVAGRAGIYWAVTPQEYAALYSPSGSLWMVYQEALGSSGAPVAISEADFIALLAAPALYLRFDSRLPLWLHYGWAESGGQMPDTPVQTVVVGVWEGAVVLAVWDGAEGYYRMATGTNIQDLEAACTVEEAPNSVLAGSSALFGGLPPHELVYTGPGGEGGGFLRLPEYRLYLQDYTKEGRLPRQLLEAFSLRYYLSEPMVSASGGLRYVDGPNELTAGADGSLLLLRSAQEESITIGLEPGSARECLRVVEYARALVDGVWQAAEASGQLSLEHIGYEAETGTYTLRFEWRIGGLYVHTPARVAYVVVENGFLTVASVRPLTIAADESVSIAYPQHAAAAGSGLLGVCYTWEDWPRAVGEGSLPDAVLRPGIVVQ